MQVEQTWETQPAQVASIEELHPWNVAVNYIELDIHTAIRLYYHVLFALSDIVAKVLALIVTFSKCMRKHTTCLYMSAISGSDVVTMVIAFMWWLGRYVNTTSVWSCKLILFCFYYASVPQICLAWGYIPPARSVRANVLM